MTNKEVQSHIQAIVAASNKPIDYQGDYMTQYKDIEKRIDALNKKVGKGLRPGRVLQFNVADGYALYFVTKVGKSFTDVAHIGLGDGYSYGGVIDGQLDTRVALQTIQWDDNRPW